MADFKLPDPKKTSGRVMGLGFAAGLGLVVWYYLVPFLKTMAWDTVSLAIACVVLGIMGSIFLSPKFWKRLNIILEALGSMLFGMFVEMNPFTILQLQLDKSEEDRRELFKQVSKLKSQEVKLSDQLVSEDANMKIAAKKVELCKEALRKNPTDEQLGYDLEAATTDYVNSKDFIEKVGPIAADINRLVKYAEKAHRKSGYALQNAKSTLVKQRAAYEAVTAGQTAMTKALRAFTGDPEMNKAAEIALNKLKNDIADKIGTIKNCISETSKLMNERDLNDAAKVSLAVKNMESIDIDKKFDYISYVEATPAHIPATTGNKWLETLKK